ncbi:hypothetical protein ACM9HF_03515 [Colwellia sp. RE-S-Sl-9]
MKIIIVIFALGWCQFSFAAGGKHILVLIKTINNYPQAYVQQKKFPSDFIKKHWDKGYVITAVNNESHLWFVVMTKRPSYVKQVYRNSASSLNDKVKDGYNLGPSTPYWRIEDGRHGDLFILNKVSSSDRSEHNYWHVGGTGKKLSNIVNNVWKKDLNILSVKELKDKKFRRHHITAGNVPNIMTQSYAYRKEFPNDYINNKRSELYELQSLTYCYDENKWFVLMSKYKNYLPWKYYSFDKNKDKINDLIKHKGYSIARVL